MFYGYVYDSLIIFQIVKLMVLNINRERVLVTDHNFKVGTELVRILLIDFDIDLTDRDRKDLDLSNQNK